MTHPTVPTRRTYAGTCVECQRSFTRRLTRADRWSCPYCGTWQAGPGAVHRRLERDRARRLAHREAQRRYAESGS